MQTWLPGPVYKSLPYAYIAMGLLFIAGVFYADPSPTATLWYVGAGIISLVGGVFVFRARVRAEAGSNDKEAK